MALMRFRHVGRDFLLTTGRHGWSILINIIYTYCNILFDWPFELAAYMKVYYNNLLITLQQFTNCDVISAYVIGKHVLIEDQTMTSW